MVDATVVLDLLKEWGYVIVFLAGMAEAMPFLGMLVPGQAVIILAGILAAQGVLELGPVIVAAIAAGIIGDAGGYYLGRWQGRAFLLRFGPRFRLEESHIERADALFHKYGPVALVLARFSFLTRGLASLLAGVHRLKQPVFWALNLVGAVVWALTYTLTGYLFGGSIEILEGILGPTIAFTVAALVLLLILYRVLKRISDGFGVEDAALAVLAGACGVLFALLAESTVGPGPQGWLDRSGPALGASLRALVPVDLWHSIAFLGSAVVLTPLVLGAIAGFAWRREWWDVFLFAAGTGGERLLTSFLQWMLAERPETDTFVGVPLFAFPSGQAAASLVFAGSVVYVLSRRFRGPAQIALIAGGVLFTLLLGFSRIALGAHSPTDVLGGWLVGAAWLLTVLLIVEAWWKTRASHRPAAQSGARVSWLRARARQ